MGIFDNIGNKVMAAGNQIGGRAKDAGEQMRLNNDIQSLNRQIQQIYQQIGEAYYNWTRGMTQAEPDFNSMCSDIDQCKVQIQDDEDRIKQLREQIACPSCGKMVPPDTTFCPYCGAAVSETERQREADRKAEEARRAAEALQARREAEAAAETQRQAAAAASGTPAFCTNCGAPLEPGAKFCTNCGQPVASLEPEMSSETETTGSSEDVQSSPAPVPHITEPAAENDLCSAAGNGDPAYPSEAAVANGDSAGAAAVEEPESTGLEQPASEPGEAAPESETTASEDSAAEAQPDTGTEDTQPADQPVPPEEGEESAVLGESEVQPASPDGDAISAEAESAQQDSGQASAGSAPEAEKTASVETEHQGPAFCSYCGAPLEPGAKFCNNCGHLVD